MTVPRKSTRPDLSDLRRILPLILVATLALAACAQFPELDARTADIDPRTPYPALVPLDPLLAGATDDQITEETGPRLEARAAALRARARSLRGAIIDDETRARMETGVAR